MEKLIQITEAITGKKVVPEESGWWQTETEILVPPTDEEGLLHELLHWVVATDAERKWPNLALDEQDVPDTLRELPQEDQEALAYWSPDTVDEREWQVCYLERVVYGMRGANIPKRTSCTYLPKDPDPEGTEKWCAERLASFGGRAFLEKVAAALESFSCVPSL